MENEDWLHQPEPNPPQLPTEPIEIAAIIAKLVDDLYDWADYVAATGQSPTDEQIFNQYEYDYYFPSNDDEGDR